jgi:glucosylglycerate synthase
MIRTDRGMLTYEGETALGPEAKERLQQIDHADVVVGIPSHRNGRTIGEVARAAAEGIRDYLPGYRVLLMNADGGSSDNTSRLVSETPVGDNVEKLVTVYSGQMGKGTAIRAILEATRALKARACLVLEARAPGIRAEWTRDLCGPVLSGQYELAFGAYQRSPCSSALSENLAYPFLHMVLNADLPDPLAPEFCLSGALAADLIGRDVWETDVARFGINIWLAMVALVEDHCMCQVSMGYRGEMSGESGMSVDARFLHTAGTMFRLLTTQRRLWQRDLPVKQVPLLGQPGPERVLPCQDYLSMLVDTMQDARRNYAAHWERTFTPKTLQALRQIAEDSPDTLDFGHALWARVVVESAVVYNKGEGDPDKVIEALMPLYYARIASFIRQTMHLTPGARQDVVRDTARAFAAAKPFLIEYWNAYQPWAEAGDEWYG